MGLLMQSGNLKVQLERAVASSQQRIRHRPLDWQARWLRAMALEWIARTLHLVVPTTARTFWGEQMRVLVPEGISSHLLHAGYFEEGLTRVLLDLLRPGMTFFDVGAHYGYFTLLASHIVGPSGRVHAFEPAPATFATLEHNTRRKQNVTRQNVALYSRAAKLEFMDYGLVMSAFSSIYPERLLPRDRKGAVPRLREVTAVTLDDYIERYGARPDLIKIDAEGSESEILRGAERVLAEGRPMITMEVADVGVWSPVPCRDLVSFLIQRGYKAFECQGETVRPHELRETYEYDNLLFVPEEKHL